MIKGAKSIAEYAIRKWVAERFYASGLLLTMDGNEAVLEDAAGDQLLLVYDKATRTVYASE